jgi:protein subunit release factor B
MPKSLLLSFISNFSASKIPKTHFSSSFSRSSGPGGQNVNKTSTKSTLFFKLSFFPSEVQKRLLDHYSNKINSKMEFVINSDVHRCQIQNYEGKF